MNNPEKTEIRKLDEIKVESDKKPHLTFLLGPRMGELHALDKEETTVGRSPDCGLWIEDSTISRRHFKIEVKKGIARIIDLGSTNGTYVNGVKIEVQILNDSDKIQISKETILEFGYLDETSRLSEKKRYEMGVIDPATGVYNKRYLLDRLREEFSFARRKKRDLSVIMFDVDHFKKINDTYGHLAGDLCLQKLTGLTAKLIRTDDIFARYGGEEFVILMRDTNGQNAVNLAERIRKAVCAQTVEYEGKQIPITISCGIASLKEAHEESQALVAEADKYLYASKEGGRNRVTGECLPNG
ncbi:MAG: GGDEF domain-containing protein [Deltaproteobacteria bacterium]|nr:GGDEF domain-containing protein [Deltaproteobacteria bacterium]